jgi:selenocysteine lyase/cysteine desulfurase
MLEGVAPRLQHVRKLLAHYVGCEKQDLALVENCTSGANAVLRSLTIPANSTLIHLTTAYGVIKNCMQHRAEECHAHVVEIRVVFRGNGAAPCGPNNTSLAEAVTAAIDAATARGEPVVFACFDHIASCPGVLMPVLELANACKSRGVPVMLDGAHVLGQLPVEVTRDLETAGVCYWISDAHKWLFSPKGSAVLWVTRSHQQTVFPAALGAAVRSARSLAAFKESAIQGLSDFELRFQYTGTRDYTPYAAIEAALHFRSLIGENAIVSYNHEMALWAQRYLAEYWGTETLTSDEHTCAMGHTRLPINTRAAATALSDMLKLRHNIHVMMFTLAPACPRMQNVDSSDNDTYWVRGTNQPIKIIIIIITMKMLIPVQ